MTHVSAALLNRFFARPVTRRLALSLSALLLPVGLLLSIPELSVAQTLRTEMPLTNGAVNALAESGTFVYLGGDFSAVGPANGRGALVDKASGVPVGPVLSLTAPFATSGIKVAIEDGANGFFVGGDFTNLGGLGINYVAHILSDGTVDPVFTCFVNGPVFALERDGSLLYIGGFFNSVDGETRQNLARIGATSGSLDFSWQADVDGQVSALKFFGPPAHIYVGGSFSQIDGQPIANLGRVSVMGGVDLSWTPNPDNAVGAIAVHPIGNNIIVGGRFTEIAGVPRLQLAAVSAATGNADPSWICNTDGRVDALSVDATDTHLYVAGEFSVINSESRMRAAKVELSTGNVDLAWIADFTPEHEVYSILAYPGSDIYVGGFFRLQGAGGAAIHHAARLNSITGGFAPGWDCAIVGQRAVKAIAFNSTTGNLFVGGEFSGMNGLRRVSLARVAKDTGIPDPAFNISVGGLNNLINALEATPSALFVGGQFSQVGGFTRQGLARINISGPPTVDASFVANLNAGGTVYSLLVDGTNVVAGGLFSSVNGTTRTNLARVSAASGAVDLGFVANVTGGTNGVLTIEPWAGATHYFVGGNFGAVNGTPRQSLAKIVAATGALDGTWQADANSTVRALAIDLDDVFVGGDFLTLEGVDVPRLAKVSALGAGVVDPVYRPNPNSSVNGLVLRPGALIAAGGYSSIGGISRDRVARLARIGTGAGDLAFNIGSSIDPSALSLLFDAGSLYLGFAGVPTSLTGFLAYNALPAVTPPPTITSISPSSAAPGQIVRIRGTNLLSSSQATFNGTASPSSISTNDTVLVAVVPAGATSGPVVVNNGFASSSGFSFTVTAPPPLTYTNGQAADLVLGQPNFTTGTSGAGATGLSTPIGVAVDPVSGKVWVADYNNSRVLRYASAATLALGAPAESVLGQPDFASAAPGTAQDRMNGPRALAFADGRLWVVDEFNHRVLRFDNAATLPNGANASAVLGQPNFSSSGLGLSATSFNRPVGATITGSGSLFVSDLINNRVLRFDNAATRPNGAPANGVLGQPNFTTNTAATNQSGFSFAIGLAVDAAGTLYVSDQGNNRVLRFNSAPFLPNGASADGVLGQVDFFANGTGLSATGMNSPSAVAVDNQGNLFVADIINHRVLVFQGAAAKPNNGAADRVFGQGGFATGTFALSNTGLNRPIALTVDAGGRVLVCVENQNRVLRYSPAPTLTSISPSSGPPGTVVRLVGTHLQRATGTVSFNGTLSNTLSGVSYDTLRAVVPIGASTGNVTFTSPSGTTAGFTFTVTALPPLPYANGQNADLVLGQTIFTSAVPASGPLGLNAPEGIAIDSATGKIFVADFTNNRVLRYASSAALLNGAAAETVLGQPDFTTVSPGTTSTKLSGPLGLALDFAGSLWVADFSNSRVLRFDNAIAKPSGAPADGVLGQTGFTTATLGTSATAMRNPVGVAVDALRNLFVTDFFNNRILIFYAVHLKPNGASADRVLGQSDFVSQTAAVGPQRLSSPHQLAIARSGHLFVADAGNQRVVVYPNARNLPSGSSATGVFGVPDLSITLSAAAGADRLNTPTGVAIDHDGNLFIGDDLNNRIVVHRAVLAKANGASADVVLGQPNFGSTTATISQNGSGRARFLTLDASGRLFVNNRTHHRILRYSPAPTLTSISPSSGPPGTVVRLIGTHLQRATGTVSFNGTPSPTFTAVSYDTLRAVVPIGASTGNVTFTSPSGTTAGFTFTVTALPPPLLATGQAADLVLGQTNFTNTANGTSATQLFAPNGIAIDPTSGKVFVADAGNNRVLRYASPAALTNGAAAEAVLGQLDFVSGSAGLAANRFSDPNSLAVDQNGRLYVSDGGNRRVLRFDNASSLANGASANGVLGQANFTSGALNLTQTGMGGPTGLAIAPNGSLFVSQFNYNRITRYDSPQTKPNGGAADGVLLQPNFTTNFFATTQTQSQGLFGLAVDSTGSLYVAARNDNRVLRFDNATTLPNGAPANAVLGQSNFTDGTSGTTAGRFDGPVDLAIDPNGSLYVVDAFNNRVLIFDVPQALPNGANASRVLGQIDLVTNTALVSQARLTTPSGIGIDRGGRAYVTSESTNHRVLRFSPAPVISSISPTAGPPGTLVTFRGQHLQQATGSPRFNGVISPSFTFSSHTELTAVVPGTATTGTVSFVSPNGTATGPTFTITVAPPLPYTNGQNADLVLGQTDFTSTGFGTTDSRLSGSEGLAIDPTTGKLFVSDQTNQRVLRFKDLSNYQNGGPAEAVFFQSDFVSSATGTTAQRCSTVADIAVDAEGRLWVADLQNSRVLRFDNASSKPSFPAADGVLGQPTFLSSAPSTSQSGMSWPTAVAVDDQGTLYVVDRLNNRVLRFNNAASKPNGANADGVLGQPDFVTSAANLTATGLSNALAAAVDRVGNLYVADRSNSRVLRYNNARSKANGAAADVVFGQPNFVSNTGAGGAQGLNFPNGVAVDTDGNLFIADALNNRVVIHRLAAVKATNAAGDIVLGQANFTTVTANVTQGGIANLSGIAVDPEGRVLISSSATANRILRYSPAPTLTSVTPNVGAIGNTITLHGTHLQRATATANFSGAAPTALASAPAYDSVTVQVPTGTTTGTVSVTTPSGTTAALPFTLASSSVPTAALSAPDPNLWITNGDVNALAQDANHVYIGGNFTYVGPNNGGSAPVNTTNGDLATTFPEVNGEVRAVVPDGSGGWYIGGLFSSVGGVARTNLAHILSTGAVDPAFTTSTNGVVLALHLDGTALYIGGGFDQINGTTRNRIGRVNTGDGTLLIWNPNVSVGADVRAIHVVGTEVYAGGNFSTIGGGARDGFARLDITSGAAVGAPWATAELNTGGIVETITSDANNVYIGGSFTQAGGTTRPNVAGFSRAGAVLNNVGTGGGPAGQVRALMPMGTTLLIAGDFITYSGFGRQRIAQILISTGVVQANFSQGTNGPVRAITTDGTNFYFGGDFTTYGGGNPCSGVIKTDNTGFPNGTWVTRTSATAANPVYALARQGSFVYVGNSAGSSIGGLIRNRVARIVKATGAADPAWDPNVTGTSVNTIFAQAINIYLGGNFTSIGGTARTNAARLTGTGAVDATWNIGTFTGTSVNTITADFTHVYLGGSFTNIAGNARISIARVLRTTGGMTTWNPAPPGGTTINKLVLSGGALYVGGTFNGIIGGQTRSRLAILDPAGTGLADLTWVPNPNATVNEIHVGSSWVYVGGNFTTIGGSGRNGIARIQAFGGTGAADLTWNPSSSGIVRAIAESSTNVFAVGAFSGAASFGGANRTYVGSTSLTSSTADSWNPLPDAAVNAVLSTPDTVYIGGTFSSINSANRRGLARFIFPPTFGTGMSTDLVLGQTTFTGQAPSAGTAGLNTPRCAAFDPVSGALFLADAANNRVLRYNDPNSLANGEPADAVLGQPNFSSTSAGTSATTMFYPNGVVCDATGTLYVMDQDNNRVLRFDNAATLANGAAASRVLGQASFTTRTVATTITGMNAPTRGVISASGDLYVADFGNSRVLRYTNVASKATGAAADAVLGQPSATSSTPATTASGMSFPYGLAIDATNTLYVSEYGNARVTVYNNANTDVTGSAAADRVLGQANFTAAMPVTTQAGMCQPSGVALDAGGRLFVADACNNRILIFNDAASLANGAPATAVLGQVLFTGANPGTGPTSLHIPSWVTVDVNGRLFAIDENNHRVLRY